MAVLADRRDQHEAADPWTAATGFPIPVDHAGTRYGDDARHHPGHHLHRPAGQAGAVHAVDRTGDQIEADPATAITYLAPGLDAWLADLKAAEEADPC